MTAPNLTPAEALECLRDRRAVDRADLTSSKFYDKWGTFASALRRAIASLETMLSEHEATKAKLAAYEQAEQRQKMAEAHAGHAKWMAEQESKDLLRLAALREPAAAVPSDEEIRKAIKRADSTTTPYAVGYLTEAIEMLAKRIGVKL